MPKFVVLSQTAAEPAASPVVDSAYAKAEAEAKAENEKRSGVGTRVMVGRTRGKGSIVISYENFDDSLPDTLPKTIQQFSDVTKVTDADTLLSYLISGYNQALYTAASDPLAEFVEAIWPDEAKTGFRLVTRNYAKNANVSLEDAVKLIKPGFVAQFGPKS